MKYLIAFLTIMSLSFYEPNNWEMLQNHYFDQKPPKNTPELFAPGIISTGSHETDITISPNLNEIYFTRTGAKWFSSIYGVKFDGEKWSDPERISFVGGQSTNYPFIAPDGKYIYFDAQGESGAPVDRDIWVAERNGNNWNTPVPLDSNINSPSTETFAGSASNGNLYFTSRRDGGIGEADIYFARKVNNGYESAQNLGSTINSEFNDFHPFIDPEERFIIFDSQRPGGFGENDLYISFKDENRTWMKPVNMGSKINTSSLEMRPYVSPDGKYLFFCSNRKFTGDHNGGVGEGSQDIYWIDAKIIQELKADILK